MLEQSKHGGGWTRRDVYGLIICIVTGILLAVSPHMATLASYGTLEYAADGDDVLYLSIARFPHQGESSLRDPFCLVSERLPTLYAWLQFAPLAMLTRWLGLPVLLMGLVWRAVGGGLLGFALYVLFRRVMADTRFPVAWALGCALVCLGDAGLIGGRSIIQNYSLVKAMLGGTTPITPANALPQYRVVTPLLNLPFFLLLVATLLPKAPRGPKWAVLGAVLMGVCIHLYFFFWTAALVGISAYLAVCLLLAWREPRERPEHLATVRFGACVMAGGLLLGLPQIISNAQTVASPTYKPTLERMSRPRHLPAGSRFRAVNLMNRWVVGKLLVGAVAILALRLRGLGLFWWLSLAGYALSNSAIVTGLEFENYHWSYVTSPMSEILMLGIVGKVLDRWLASVPWLMGAFWVAPLAIVGAAVLFRPYEALKAPEAAEATRLIEELRPLRPALSELEADCSLAGPRVANFAILFTRAGQLFDQPHSIQSSLISGQEGHERFALNHWLMGIKHAEFVPLARPKTFHTGPDPEEPGALDEAAETRIRLFDEIDGDSSKASELLLRYRPCALILPSDAEPPTRGGPWKRAGESPRWILWTADRADAHGRADP
jgi:hypothetical protein